jgi:hypothetical protein
MVGEGILAKAAEPDVDVEDDKVRVRVRVDVGFGFGFGADGRQVTAEIGGGIGSKGAAFFFSDWWGVDCLDSGWPAD